MDLRPFTLRDAVRGIYSRKIRVIIFAVSVFALAVAATILVPKSFYSESKLFVRLGRENVGLDPTTTLGEGPAVSVPMSREDEINSIVELIKSKPLLEQVVDTVGAKQILRRSEPSAEGDGNLLSSLIDGVMGSLKSIGLVNDIDERERAVLKLSDKLDVKAIRKSNVIAITFETHKPELAQQVVEKLVENYVTQHVSLNRGSGSAEFLRQQTQSAEDSLTQSEKAFEAFKNRTGMLALVEQRNVLVERMANLENNYLQTVADTEAMKSEIDRLKNELDGMSPTLEISRKVGTGNQGVDGMRQDVFKLEMRYQELMSMREPNHPSVRQIKKQLDESRKIMERAQQQVIESVSGRNLVYDNLKMELHRKEPQYQALLMKASTLLAQTDDVRSKLADFNSNETEFVELERRVAIHEEKFRRYAKNLQQAEIDFSLESQQLSNITVAQAATLNPKPVRPQKLLNLALGLFAGIFGGCGIAVLLEYFDPTLRTREDAETEVDLPVVASVPTIRAQNQPETFAGQV